MAIVIKTKLIRTFTFKGIVGVTIWPFIILDPEFAHSKELMNHEEIHIAQQKEMLVIGFFVAYLYYFLKNLIKYRSRSEAYYRIPFEREAYMFQHNFSYLSRMRRSYGWWEYR